MKIRHQLAIAMCSGLLAGCSSGNSAVNGGPGGPGTPAGGDVLAGTAKGRMLVTRLPADVKASKESWGKNLQTTVTSAKGVDRSGPAGIAFDAAGEEDKSRTAQGQMKPGLISLSSKETLAGGTRIKGMSKAPADVYFENGNFGDPQVTSDDAAVSAVGVYNTYKDGKLARQFVLTEATTVRYRDGADGDKEANFGVGYVGNPTAAMPNSGTASYDGFLEQATSVYTKADGSVAMFGFDQDPKVGLKADFGAGTVKGGVSGSRLVTYDGGSKTVLNRDITGLAIDAKINGSEYAGTANFVDKAGKSVGTVTQGAAIGGFFGAGAKETAAAVAVEGNAKLGGNSSDYVYQAVIGGVKK